MSIFKSSMWLVLFVLAATFSACTGDTLLPTQDVVPPIRENMPAHQVFLNGDDFVAALSTPIGQVALANIHPDATEAFTSYSSHFTMIEAKLAALELAGNLPKTTSEIELQFGVALVGDDEDGLSIEPKIKAPRLANIANEYGVFQIGEKVYQVSNDKVFWALEENIDNFTDLSTALNVAEDQFTDSNRELKKPRKLEGLCTRNYFVNGREHRLKPRWYSQEYKAGKVDFIEIWIEIKHQKRGFLNAWYANQEDRIWTDGSIRHYNGGAGSNIETFTVDHDDFNVSKLIVDVHAAGRDYPLQSPSSWIVSTSWALHSTRDGGTSANCTIVK